MDVECFFTMILCYVVLTVAVAKVTNNPSMFGLAIGSCVTVGGNAIGAVSGGNSTVSNVAAYIAAEVAGAAIAAALFKVTHAVEFSVDDKDEEKEALMEDNDEEKARKADYSSTSERGGSFAERRGSRGAAESSLMDSPEDKDKKK